MAKRGLVFNSAANLVQFINHYQYLSYHFSIIVTTGLCAPSSFSIMHALRMFIHPCARQTTIYSQCEQHYELESFLYFHVFTEVLLLRMENQKQTDPFHTQMVEVKSESQYKVVKS